MVAASYRQSVLPVGVMTVGAAVLPHVAVSAHVGCCPVHACLCRCYTALYSGFGSPGDNSKQSELEFES